MESIAILAALLFGVLARSLGLPVLIGYLAAGFVLSTTGMEQSEALHQLASLGLSLLLFTVGLHLRGRSFFRPEVLLVSLLHLSISTIFFTGILYLWYGEFLYQVGCALGFSSTVVTVSVLEQRKELGSFIGRGALGILVIQDLVSVFLIAESKGATVEIHWLWAFALPPILLLARSLLSLLHARELFLLCGFAASVGASEFFTALGLSGHLGALLAGAAVANHSASEQLAKELWGTRELLLLALFLSVGLYGLPGMEDLVLVIILLLALPLKGVLFFFMFLAFRLRARTAFFGACSLCAYSEFLIVVSYSLAVAGILPPEVTSATALTTAISFALCSLLVTYANELWDIFAKPLSPFQRSGLLVDQSPPSFGSADILIIGMGQTGVAAYQRALELGHRPVGIDSDPNRVSARLHQEQRVIQADCQDGSFWSEVNITHIKAIVFTIPSLRAKLEAIDQLRRIGYGGEILALARNSRASEALAQVGIRVSVIPMVESGRELAERVGTADL